MTALHKAALARAYRTLAQGLQSGAVVTALIAALTAYLEGSDAALSVALASAGVALATTVGAAIRSFWQGVAEGLPEVDQRSPLEAEADRQAGANDHHQDPYV